MASIKNLKRMCSACRDCERCPMSMYLCTPEDLPDNADKIVDKWISEHPVKTYAMDFFEKFPNASRMQNGRTPNACVKDLYGIASINCLMDTCENCWNREMEGV